MVILLLSSSAGLLDTADSVRCAEQDWECNCGTDKTKGAQQPGVCVLLYPGNKLLAEAMDGEEGVRGLELAGETGKGQGPLAGQVCCLRVLQAAGVGLPPSPAPARRGGMPDRM